MSRAQAGLRTLLRARDLGTVQHGLELLRALEDPAIVEKLLSGVRYEGRFLGARERAEFRGPYRGKTADYAITWLLAMAPTHPLALAVTRLDLEGEGPLSLQALAGLPRLEQLHLHRAGPFHETEGEGGFPCLTTVSIRQTAIADLDWLQRAPELVELVLEQVPARLLPDFLPLRRLRIADANLRDLDGLRRYHALEELELATPRVRDPTPLARLPNLRSFSQGRGSLDVAALRAKGVRIR